MMRDITDVPLVQKLTNTPATCSETTSDPPAPNANPLPNPLASADRKLLPILCFLTVLTVMQLLFRWFCLVKM